MMQIIVATEITNPKYSNVEETMIDCIVKFEHLPSPVPFTASADDPEPHGRAIYAALIEGVAGEIAAFDAPEGV